MQKAKPIPIGTRFTRWTVIAYAGTRGRHRYWLCRCDCGTEREVSQGALRAKGQQASGSCGCLGHANRIRAVITHGMTHSSEFKIWTSIKQRCLIPHNDNYPDYGGRGIRVCDRWCDSFEEFYADMGPRPSSRHSIDRIDVNGHYEPGNCRWATAREQCRNKRTNFVLTFQGKTQCAAAWSEEIGLPAQTIIARVRRYGWSDERALTEPINFGRRWLPKQA